MKHFFTSTKKLVATVAVAAFFGTTLSAQMAYTRSFFTGAYTPVSGSATALTFGSSDDGVAAVPLPFDFTFAGTTFTNTTNYMIVCTNGWIGLQTTSTLPTALANNREMSTTTAPNNLLCPWWDDLSVGAVGTNPAGGASWEVTGSAPNRVLTVQWVVSSYYTTTGGQPRMMNFQAKMYETTNVIEYMYGNSTGAVLNTNESACIGIEDGVGGNNHYLDGVTGTGLVNSSYLNSAQFPKFNFRFMPGVPTPIAGGTYNVGVGQTYRNITDAFCDLANRGIAGAVTLNLTDALYDTTAAGGNNIFPLLLGPVAGTSAANTITVTKSSTAAVVSWGGAQGTSGQLANQATATALSSNVDPIIGLVGADYVTINNLDIRGNVGARLSDYGIALLNSSATDGSQNNTFSNISVTMSRGNTGSRGFWSSTVTTPSAATGANSNNTFRDFAIRNVYAGIQMTGNATFPDLNTMFINSVCTSFNIIGDPSTANDIGNAGTQTYGIRLTNLSGFTISNCSIRNVTGSAIQTDGIFIETFQGTCSINNNKIQTIRNSSTSSTTGISGIRMTHTTTGTHTMRVYNNAVSEIISSYTGAASAARTLKGIFISGTGGSTSQAYEVYNNSVSMDGSASLNVSSTCFELNTTSGPVITLANNIFSNTTATQGGTSRHYGIVSTSATQIGNTGSNSNNNDIYVANDIGTSGFAVLGNATTYNTVALWTGASTYDAASISVNPAFTGAPSNLHATALSISGAGMAPPAYITLDLDCAPRVPDNDIGAYVVAACTGMPTAGTITGLTSVCDGTGTTLTLTGASGDAGVQYQWASSTTAGGPYTTLLGTSLSQATGNLTVTTYYVVGVLCSVSGQATQTLEFAVTVLPNPTVSVTPSSATYCLPGGPAVVLTGNGAATYNWSPSTGLSATTGTTVNASPSATTTYTVVGTAANGCTASGTSAVTVSETPGVSSVTATPPSVCSGGNSQLAAAGGTTSAYTITSIPFAGVPTPGIGVTTLANNGTQVTALSAGSLDDGGWASRPLPFTFMFYGQAYTSFAVSTNGFIYLGAGAPNTYTGYATTLPNTGTSARPAIGACYSDLDFRTIGTIEYFVTGTAPNRAVVVKWTNGNFYNGVGSINTQLIIYEGSNVIEVHTTSSTGNNAAVEGLHNAAGTASSTVAGRNNANFTVTVPEAYRWAPSGGTLTYAWLPTTFLNNAAISNPLATSVTATTTYTVSISNGGCSATGTVTLVAGAALSATSSVAPASAVCAGTTVALSGTAIGGGAPYTYAWTGPNSFSSSAQNPSLGAVTVAMSGTYSLVITDGCAASFTTTVALTVDPLPAVTVAPTSATFCNGGPGVSLTAGGASTYSWSPAAGLSATTGSNVTASPTVTTTYVVTGTSGAGCIATATTAITSAPGVSGAAATSTQSAVCTGSSVDLGASANTFNYTILQENFNTGAPTWTRTNLSTGGNPANAAWTDRPDGYVYAAGTPYHSNDNTQFVQSNSDAQGSGSTTRTFLQSPVFSTTGFSAVNVGFYHYYRDIADPGDSAVVEASLDGINWTIAGAYTVNTGTENNFATASVALPATFDNQPTVYVRFRYIGTWDWYWSIDNVTVSGQSSSFTYAWTSSPVGFTSSTQNPTGVMPTANTTYSVTITNPFGCTGSASVNVAVNASPTVTASAATNPICENASEVFNGGGAVSYVWTGGVMDNVAFNAPSPAGNYSYTVTGTDANGCTDTASVTLVVNALPLVSISGPSAICVGDTATLNGSGGGTSQWYMDGSPIVGANTSTYLATAPGVYNMTKTNLNGCTDSAAVGHTLIINALPVVTASATPSTVCAGDMVTASGSGASTYVWSGGITDAVPFAAMSSATYTVTGTDVNGCEDTATVAVNVNALPVVGASASDSSICPGDSVMVMGSGALSYAWSGGAVDMVNFAPAATDTYTVTGTDANGCTNTASVMITVNALPSVTLSLPLDTICTNFGTVALSGETPAGGTWSGPGMTGNVIDPVLAGVGTHAIMYMYMDSATGCSATATDSVVVDVCNGIDENTAGNAVIFPNPNNGDFTLIPSGTGVVDVMIYNATGQLVSAEQMNCGVQNKISIAASGMYSVVIVTADGHRTTQRVIVNR